MTGLNLDDTIAAVSTPIGEAGIGIVRLSGRDALKIADNIFLSKDRKKPSRFKTYTVHYGHIIESSNSRNNGRRIIDEVLLTVMRRPKSYTKEDIVEINCHSGIAPLKKILDLTLLNGARLAQPGEFTKRAFLNGRIDMLQAESVLDIIRAKTDLTLRSAVNNLDGVFSKKINSLRDGLMNILAHIEASIDFSEEDDVDRARKKDILNRLRHVRREIERLVLHSDQGKVLRQGIRTVICGSPNVGKSSLMNAILKESRAIVTHIPGTTRDTIEETANIKGVPVVLIDTAGISAAVHPVTKEGVKRSHFSIDRADLVLLVLDYARPLKKTDFDIMRKVKGKETLIVINKKDLTKKIDVRSVRKLFPRTPIVYTSAIDLSGIEELERTIKERVFRGKVPTPDFISISNDRQVEILRRSLSDVKEAIGSISKNVSIDCVAIYVRSAVESMGEVTGHTITEEALDKIFSQFCIGK